MQHDVTIWHYLLVFGLLLVLGAVTHVCRAVFNIWPDRLSDKPMLDVFVSSDYSMSDYLFGLEFDENGYYRLDSAKNLRFYCFMTALSGMAMMLFMPDIDVLAAAMIDRAMDWAADLFWYRTQHVRLF